MYYNKFSSIEQSINYAECHDNATVFDKFIISNGHEDEYCRQKRCLLTLAMTILARGVPFLFMPDRILEPRMVIRILIMQEMQSIN